MFKLKAERAFPLNGGCSEIVMQLCFLYCSCMYISSPLGIVFVSTRALKCGTLKAFPNITYENLVAICHACTVIYHLLTETEGNSVFCGPETVDVSRGEAEGNIDGRGSTKHTAFPRSQSISVLLYINSQRNNKLKNK